MPLKIKISKDYKSLIKTYNNFPKQGVKFYDTSQIFLNPYAYNALIEDAIEILKEFKVDALAAVEARGWPYAASIANLLEIPVIYIYKENKLPKPTIKQQAISEYSTRYYEMDLDPNLRYQNVAIIDDIVATAGTIKCVKKMLEAAFCRPVVVWTLLKISNLVKESDKFDIPIKSLVEK